jgi:hypothetical protein
VGSIPGAAKVAEVSRATLAAYAHPLPGDASVQAINTALIMKVIEPIGATRPETALRWLQL